VRSIELPIIMYVTPIGSEWKKLQKIKVLSEKTPWKVLTLVHLLWQMQFLRRKFVEEKTVYESRKNSSFMCWSNADAFIL